MSSRFTLHLLVLLLIASSCSSGNNVVEKGVFQKRKHNHGFYFAGFQKSKAALPKFPAKANNENQEPSSLHQESSPVLFQNQKREQYIPKTQVLATEGIIKKNQPELASFSNDLTPLVQVKPKKFNEGLIQTNKAAKEISFWDSYFIAICVLLFSILGWLLLAAFTFAFIADLMLLASGALALSLVLEIIAGIFSFPAFCSTSSRKKRLGKRHDIIGVAALISLPYWLLFWVIFHKEISLFLSLW